MLGMKYNGRIRSNKYMASIIPTFTGYPDERIKSQAKWLVKNCTDINGLDCEIVLEELWYDVIGIYNDQIETIIKKEVALLIETGLIQNW